MKNVFCASAAVLSMALATSAAQAGDDNDKELCIRSADEGQQLRDDGTYDRARAAFAQCARPVCPALVRRDCAHWLSEMNERAPTFVVQAKDDKGGPLADVIVLVDGEPVAAKSGGQPRIIDPGEHLFRFEAAGFSAVEQRVVLRAQEKDRVIDVQFGPRRVAIAQPELNTPSGSGDAPEATHEAPVPTGDHAVPPASTSPPLAAFIFAGVAGAAFANEAFFGIAGMKERNDDLSARGCAPHCGAARTDSVRTKFAIADVSLAVGVASLGTAVYFFFVPRAAAMPKDVAIDVFPREGGAVATVGARF